MRKQFEKISFKQKSSNDKEAYWIFGSEKGTHIA